MRVTSRYLRAVFWFARMTSGLFGGGEGKLDIDDGRGHSMTLPKGAKVDWVRSVGWMVKVGDRIEGAIVTRHMGTIGSFMLS